MWERRKEGKQGERVQWGHIVKQTVLQTELFTMIMMMMQEHELENTVEENTLAEDLSPLSSHPETWDDWNGIRSYTKELRKGLRLYFKEKPKCCLKSFQTGRLLWYVMFWVSLFCFHTSFSSISYIKCKFSQENRCKWCNFLSVGCLECGHLSELSVSKLHNSVSLIKMSPRPCYLAPLKLIKNTWKHKQFRGCYMFANACQILSFS